MQAFRLLVLAGAIASLLWFVPLVAASEAGSPIRSATIARDVNGIKLGDHIQDIGRFVRLEAVGGDSFDGWHDGIEYDFGVTPLGRIYRIGMEQELGNFTVDAEFIQSMEERLFSKYGQPNVAGRNPWGWKLVEIVRDAYGTDFHQETNWMNASVTSGFGDAWFSIKMLDFRILWRDMNALNEDPRDDAIGAVQF